MHYEAVFGESLYILGSISALGSWRIESALRMNWTEVKELGIGIMESLTRGVVRNK